MVPAGVGSAEALAALVAALAGVPTADSETEAIDRIRVLEELKAACAAAQVRETEALYSRRCADEAARGIPARDRGRGVAAEVALARRESPSGGSRSLGLARTLVGDMPHTMAALADGTISEFKATVMVRETVWLPAEARREVDALMADRLDSLGIRRLGGEARSHAQRLDPAAAVRHLDRAVTERRVSVRPAPGGMAYLTALLPMGRAVACLAALRRSAATATGTGEAAARTQDQVMADLLVERVTGQARAQDVPVEIHLVMSEAALLRGEETPAWIAGHGPLPAGTARSMIGSTDGEVFLRRLYTAPESGHLVGMDSRRREFGGLLRRLVLLRDDTCRTPWCDAPIRHVDHATPHRDGGPTSLDNASGLCARCNYTKENAGWVHAADPGGLAVTTPTGHRYERATAALLPAAPGDPPTGMGPPRRQLPGYEMVFGRGGLYGKVIPVEAAQLPAPRGSGVFGVSVGEAQWAQYLASPPGCP